MSSSSSSSSSMVVFFFLQFILVFAQGGIKRDWGDGERVAIPSPEILGICEGIIRPQGYNCQEFEVKTRDGYILSMQRIPEGRAGGGGGGLRRPVLLQHGILMAMMSRIIEDLVGSRTVWRASLAGCNPIKPINFGASRFGGDVRLLLKDMGDVEDGMTWLLNSPQQSLAFVLADSGFDVWIANTRGTQWSRRHVSIDPSSPEYWSWSWDELVAYDMPATVHFVYGQTGQKLHFVGHSLGTLIALASFSEGRLVGQLRSAALLCPVAHLSHMKTPIGILAARAFLGEIISSLLGVAEFNPKGKIVSDFLHALCRSPGVDCYDLLRSFTGNNCCLNASTVDLFLKYEPQPTSTKTLVHLAQTFRDGILTKYDYEYKNMEYYGQIRPPIYDLSRIPKNFPLFLSYGGQDSLSDVLDVELLLDDLKFHDVDKLDIHYVKDYAHADFVMGVSAKQTVYNAIIAFFNKQ